MVDIVRVKLITVIAPVEFQDRLGQDILRLGAGGYTVSMVDGRGKSGLRARGLFEISNMRMETLVPAAKADAILAQLAREAETLDMVVFCQDVDAIPRKRFV
jgi:nitrogen regulatory protein PII